MYYTFEASMTLQAFLDKNTNHFEEILLTEAAAIREDVRDILQHGNIDLVTNARQIVAYTIQDQEEELLAFAQKEGVMWAASLIELSVKLEWIHALRRTIWILIEAYQRLTGAFEPTQFFRWERDVNNQIDAFLNTFLRSYNTYKNEVLKEQEALVEDLSAPLIPVQPSVGVLPLVGTMNEHRVAFLKEKILTDVGGRKLRTLMIDLSGVARMETNVLEKFQEVLDGVTLMGCEPVITGMNQAVAMETAMASSGWRSSIQTFGSLQQALQSYMGPQIPTTIQEGKTEAPQKLGRISGRRERDPASRKR